MSCRSSAEEGSIFMYKKYAVYNDYVGLHILDRDCYLQATL